MAEEKKSGKAQAFLMAHFEKLALGVSIAALIAWLALSMTSSNPEMEKAKKILANSGNEPPPAGPPVGPGASGTHHPSLPGEGSEEALPLGERSP